MTDIRIIVCGGRDYDDRERVREVLAEYTDARSTIVHGDQRGADRLAGEEAEKMGLTVESFPADWSYGRQAGPIRNTQMLEHGVDLVIAFRGGSGTQNCVKQARERGVEVRVVR